MAVVKGYGFMEMVRVWKSFLLLVISEGVGGGKVEMS